VLQRVKAHEDSVGNDVYGSLPEDVERDLDAIAGLAGFQHIRTLLAMWDRKEGTDDPRGWPETLLRAVKIPAGAFFGAGFEINVWDGGEGDNGKGVRAVIEQDVGGDYALELEGEASITLLIYIMNLKQKYSRVIRFVRR